MDIDPGMDHELEIERLKNQKLARELTRLAFEKEVLAEQVESLKKTSQRGISSSGISVEELAQAIEGRLEASIAACVDAKLTQAIARIGEAADSRPASTAVEIVGSTAISVAVPAPPHTRVEAPPEVAEKMTAQTRAKAGLEVEQLKRQLIGERVHFRKIAANFLKEIEFMKRVHPLRSLLAAKDAELARVKKIIQNVPGNHPERRQMERLIQAHESERREIMLNLRQMESTLSEQTKQIDEAIQSADPETLADL